VTAVLGSGNSALTAALRLAEIASKVYLINRSSELKGEAIWQEQVRNNPKIELIVNNTIKALKGENKLEAIVFENHYSDSDELAVDGLFIEIGTTPDDSLFTALDVRTTDKGYIITDASQMTSLPGLFAAGDITTASNGFRQIITACAEGAVAIDSISNYLRRV
jgi:thioredoxin reductase (NADPH)